MTKRIFLSLIIATYNRAALVDEAIASLAKQIDPITREPLSDIFEILVVDNASNDDTIDVAERWRKEFSNIRYCLEVRQGVSYARNLGILEAQGLFVVFMDDECTVAEDYVSNLIAGLRNANPIIFGGPVYPRYALNSVKPAWFSDKYGTFSHFAYDVPTDEIWLSGANMGGRRDALIEVGGFSIQLGPKGERMIYGEEQEIIDRIKNKFGSSSLRYFRNVVVYHLVRPEKFSVIANFREQCLRGYWRGQLSNNSSQSGSAKYSTEANTKNIRLLFELIKTPMLRDKSRYPYLQNYLIEVVAPFIRIAFVGLGKLHRRFSRLRWKRS